MSVAARGGGVEFVEGAPTHPADVPAVRRELPQEHPLAQIQGLLLGLTQNKNTVSRPRYVHVHVLVARVFGVRREVREETTCSDRSRNHTAETLCKRPTTLRIS